jgi:hypothetical protein
MTLENDQNNNSNINPDYFYDLPNLTEINNILSSLDIPLNDNIELPQRVDFYKFVLRDDKIAYIPKEELESLFFEDTFFGGLIRANSSYSDNSENTFEIWEDYNTFMSIIESVRLNDLIVYEDVNLSYMYALCDKWCITNPVLIEKLNKKVKTNTDIIKGLNDMLTTFECKNCKKGFSTTNNYDGSCVYVNNDDEEIKGKHVMWESQKESVSKIIYKLPSAIVNRLIT